MAAFSGSELLPKTCFNHICEAHRAGHLKPSKMTLHFSMDMSPIQPHIEPWLVYILHVGHEPSGSKLYFFLQITRPYQMVNFIHTMRWTKDVPPPFIIIKSFCNASQSGSEDEVKALYCLIDHITGVLYVGWCSCTAG